MKKFTLIELLVVVAIIGILAAILLPALLRAKKMARRVVCMSNEAQVGKAMIMWSDDNDGDIGYELPADINDKKNSAWPWDIAEDFTDTLEKQYGCTREVFYCPDNQDQNIDPLWDFPKNTSRVYRVTGFAYMYQRYGPKIGECFKQPYMDGDWVTRPDKVDTPETVALISDAILEKAGNFHEIQGGYTHRSSHLFSTMPEGSNIFYVDGHSQWNDFVDLQQRADIEDQQWFWW